MGGSDQAADNASVSHLLTVCGLHGAEAPWLSVSQCGSICFISSVYSSLIQTLGCLSMMVFNSSESFHFFPYF